MLWALVLAWASTTQNDIVQNVIVFSFPTEAECRKTLTTMRSTPELQGRLTFVCQEKKKETEKGKP